MSADAQKARSVFLAAGEGHPPGRWGACPGAACAGDPELRRRVEALLHAHTEANSLLDTPPPAPAATLPHLPREGLDEVVGPYRLLELIGEGGMGAVFRAEQTQPVR